MNRWSRALACHHFGMPLWVIIYWIVAIGLFLVWVYRRISARKAKQVASTSTDPTAARSDSSSTSPAEKVWPAPPPPAPDDDTFRLDGALETPPAVSEQVDGLAAGSSSGDAAALTGAMPDPVPTTATLPELLAGITLPHELVPLTQIDVPLDLATHVVVATEKANADTVATGLTEELERLGYEVQRESMTKLTAAGSRGIVGVEIHPDGASVLDGGIRRFPTAAERMVVVELHAG